MKKMYSLIIFVFGMSVSAPIHALLGDGGAGWAQIPYLVKILAENYKRYQQLKGMTNEARHHQDWVRLVHQGLENAGVLLEALPVKDERILSQLRNIGDSLSMIEKVYGAVPKSKDELLHRLHDNSAAESLRMIYDFQKYAEKQESNSIVIALNSRKASPKGAARMQAETSAQMLRSLSQLIRLNSQMLKLQSEKLAFDNRNEKGQVLSYQRVNNDLGAGFKNYSPNMTLPKF